MGHRHKWRSGALPLLLILTGCAAGVSHQRPEPVSGLSADAFPLCDRGPLPAESAIVLPSADGPSNLGRLPYRRLCAREAQCLAVKNSALANALDGESQAAQQQAHPKLGHHDDPAADLRAQVLTQMALEDRNRSAAKALDAYYRLGEAEAKRDLLEATSTQVKDALSKAKSVKASGLELPFDETSLERQLADLQLNTVQVGVQIAELNSDLRRYLGVEPCADEWLFWPVDAFVLPVAWIDAGEAVAVGLEYRPDLRGLDLIEHAVESGDLDSIRKLLALINGALGQSQPPACPCVAKLVAMLCGKSAKEAQLETRTQQVTELHTQRRREAVEEIRQAARTVQAQMAVVPLGRERAASWQQRVRLLQEKETKGLGSFLATTEGKVEQFQAQRKLVEEMTNLQRASVKLRQTQGILPQECFPSAATPETARHTQPSTPPTPAENLPPPSAPVPAPAPPDRPVLGLPRATDPATPSGSTTPARPPGS